MKIERCCSVFWILMIVLWSTVNMDLCTQILDFCECRSTQILDFCVQKLCVSFDRYMKIEKGVVDILYSNDCIVEYSKYGFMHTNFGFL